MRKPFTLEEHLAHPEWKVETGRGNTAIILDAEWNDNGEKAIIIKIPGHGKDNAFIYTPGGERKAIHRDDDDNLFLVTPEPELTEFEKRIRFTIDEVAAGRYNADNIEDVKGIAKGLLELARKQLQPEIDAMLEDAYKTADEVQYRKGREEALKDLPRWKPSNCPRSNLPSLYLTGDGTAIYKDGYEISISGLEKLPKEETNL